MKRFCTRVVSVCLLALTLTAPAVAAPRDPSEDLGTRIIRIIRHFLPHFGAAPKDDYPGPTHP